MLPSGCDGNGDGGATSPAPEPDVGTGLARLVSSGLAVQLETGKEDIRSVGCR